jgi:hypothetical protein
VGEGTVPVKDLNKDGQGKTAGVDEFDRTVPHSEKCPKDEKEDPEEMDEDDNICKDSID